MTEKKNTWKGGGLLGSLRGHINQLVLEHQRTNPALKEHVEPKGKAIIRRLLGFGTMTWALATYAVLIVFFLVTESIVQRIDPSLVPNWGTKQDLKDITGVLLTAQTAAIGLIFPVAISIVTVLKDSADGRIRTQAYYHEAMVKEVGLSGITLTLVLAVQLLWPAHFLLHLFGLGTTHLFFKICILIVHILWFALNMIGLWFCLKTSLDFVAEKHSNLLKGHMARLIIPQDIKELLSKHFSSNIGHYLLEGTGAEESKEKIVSGYGSLMGGIPEVSVFQKKDVVLHDIRMGLLRHVVCNWAKRTDKNDFADSALSSDIEERLIFPLSLGEKVCGHVVVCETRGKEHLSRFEKLLVRYSFCFRSA